MILVSQKRWQTAQKEEKQYCYHSSDQNYHSMNTFFIKNFFVDTEFFGNQSILEVGCSPAATIHGINKSHLNVGIDPLSKEWTRLYERNTCHIQGMGEYLPLKNEFFDAILCINTLDHVQAPCGVLKEIRRCLKEKGNLFLWVQTFSTLKIVRKFLYLIDVPHPHHFTDNEIKRLLHEMGYQINYHQCKKADILSALSVIKAGMIFSGVKSLLANLFLGLHESSFLCSKDGEQET